MCLAVDVAHVATSRFKSNNIYRKRPPGWKKRIYFSLIIFSFDHFPYRNLQGEETEVSSWTATIILELFVLFSDAMEHFFELG